MLTWLKRLFSPSGSWLNDGHGHDLHWRLDEVPINVYLDRSLLMVHVPERAAMARAVAMDLTRRINSDLRRPLFMLPVEPIDQTLEAFANPVKRKLHRRSILIYAYDRPKGANASFCHTDHRLDTRNGEVINAIVDWEVTGNPVEDLQTLEHELWHCLGVGHAPNGIMRAVRQPGSVEALSQDQLRRIRREYT